MKKITEEEIAKSIELYKWVSPTLNPAAQIWNKGDDIRPHTLYKYSVGKNVQAIWVDFENLQEPHFIRKSIFYPMNFYCFIWERKQGLDGELITK